MNLGPFSCKSRLLPSGFLTKREVRDHLKGIDIDGRIILKWI
jgi:hypothetical protein